MRRNGNPSRPLLSVIIVSYNVRELLTRCLLSLQRTGLSTEVIVIDNASEDGSPELVKTRFPHVILLRNKTNEGFASATNSGLARAHGEYLLLLNPDTEVTPGALERLLSHFRTHPDTSLAGPNLVFPDGRHQFASARYLPTGWRLTVMWTYFNKLTMPFSVYWPAAYRPSGSTMWVEAISGACMMLPRRTLDKIGPLDEELPMEAEDIDYCQRVLDSGGTIAYIPDAVVVHVHGASMRQHAEDTQFRSYRAPLYFLRKHRGRRYVRRLRWPFCLVMAFRAAVNLALVLPYGHLAKRQARGYLRLLAWGLTRYEVGH